MLNNWSDTPTANPRANGSVKLENRQFDDQLAWPVLARHVCAKQRCPKSKVLILSPGVLQHLYPKGGVVAQSQPIALNH